MVKRNWAPVPGFEACRHLLLVLFVGHALTFSFVRADVPAASGEAHPVSRQEPADLRTFSVLENGQWIGNGISYGPYRQGQAPGGNAPSRDEILEDLRIMAKHWSRIRIYGADDVAVQVLQLIRDEKIPLKVMLGAWITRETYSDPLDESTAKAAQQANRSHVAMAIRLANAFPEEVNAVSVGNETQVYWSDHVTKPEVLIQYIREMRSAVKQPVTTADDFNFWNKPESQLVAHEIDFIVLHVHALWAGALPEAAMEWTKDIYAKISALHPHKTIVIGEAGWATQVHDEGEQAKLIKGEASEATQADYYRQFTDWSSQQKIGTFFFEAFDEPWKGGPHPNEVEKHWGLFNVDRTPKEAMIDRE